MNKSIFIYFVLLCSVGTSFISKSAGPDIVVNQILNAQEFGRNSQGWIGISAGTDSCNIGTQAAEWKRPPSNQHPVISLNLYRLDDNKIQQLGMSWIKHGFFATNATDCNHIPGAPSTCSSPPGHNGQKLYPGCTDLYPAALNASPTYLGPRSKINPTTVSFDGASARDLTGYPTISDVERLILVAEQELQVPGARYFIESQYLSADDSTSNNALNNFSYIEVTPQLSGNRYSLPKKPGTNQVYLEPSFFEFKNIGGRIEHIETEEEVNAKSHLYVASNVSALENGIYRYDYAIFNMNSDDGVGQLKIPAVGKVTGSIGFYAPKYQGEIYSNEPWHFESKNGSVTWKTSKPYDENPNVNALRWGTTFNFWFESSNPPGEAKAVISRFKKTRNGIDQTTSVDVIAPIK